MNNNRSPLVWVYRLAFRGLQAWRLITRPVIIGVIALLVRDEQVLLVEHTYRRGWHFPGGSPHRRETLEQAMRRELDEELGLMPVRLALLGLYTDMIDGATNHLAVFVSDEFTMPAERPNVEIERARWFPFDGLPAGLDPGYARRLAEYRQGRGVTAGRW